MSKRSRDERSGAVPVSLGSPRFTTLQAGSFLVTEARFPAAYRIPTHFHDRPVVGITLAGEWDSVLGATRLVNAPGTLHVEPAGDCHSNRFGNRGGHVLVIQPDPADTTLRPFQPALSTAHQLRVGPSGMLSAERLTRELAEPDDLTPLAIESLSVDLLIAASRLTLADSGAIPAWLTRAVDYLHARFLERPSLGVLGRVAAVSPEHFNKEFRRRYGVGAAEYIRRLRLDWAAERLRRDEESVADIAALAGFADQSHFTRRFRRQFGVTPAAFRGASRRRFSEP